MHLHRLVAQHFPKQARHWCRRYDGEGKNAALTSAGAGLASASKGAGGSRSMYDERAFLKEVTEPTVGDGKVSTWGG